MAINFPDINPIALQIGPIIIRWYALAYITGLFGGLKYVDILLQKRPPSNDMSLFDKKSLDDLFGFVAFGVILGGRLGYVLFYKPSYYFDNLGNILKLWEGGMSFHGGLLGVIIGVIIFAHRGKFNPLAVGDYITAAVPIGLFFGRIANFINGELYGRMTDVAWGVRFPTFDGYTHGHTQPRHPSQLYEALTEGLLLFILLHYVLYYTDILKKRGQLIGVFLTGYAIARIFSEFFREPDSFLGFVITAGGAGVTQGMILSIPMLFVGVYLIVTAKKSNV